MGMTVMAWLMVAAVLPLFIFLLLTFLGRRMGRAAGWIATGFMAGSLALSVFGLVQVGRTLEEQPGASMRYVEAFTRHWVTLPAQRTVEDPFAVGASAASTTGVTVGACVDSLTVTFFIIVSFVATIVHLFSLWYMAGEMRAPRYFALLNLLCFAMFLLLLANSLLQVFAAWQLLGIAAWFLVHFNAGHRAPVIGSLRMFVINRIGDAAFLAGLGLLVANAGAGGGGGGGATGATAGWAFFDQAGTSVLTNTIRAAMGVRSSEFLLFTGGFLGLHWLTWMGICFLVAILVRAAQFPFLTWLAETTEAPAPAAALLQTCTLVASAIYLLARLYPILTLDVRLILAIVGCTTAVLGALIACAQLDYRKVLAWTTVSQMGYVVLFLGAGGYIAGMLHLFTHAFTKAGLILAAGSVLQALPTTNGATGDLRPLGGLWKRMPITAGASLIAVLSLAGMPFMSGSYSGNLGLAAVYDYAAALSPAGAGESFMGINIPAPQMLLFWLPASAVLVTAFAIGRWWWLLFVSPPRNAKLIEDVHESAPMTLPLIIMAFLSIGKLYEFFGVLEYIRRSLLPTTLPFVIDGSKNTSEWVASVTAVLGPVGLVMAFFIYFKGFGAAESLRRAPGFNLLYVQVRDQFYLQAFYEGVLVKGVMLLARVAYYIDRYILSALYRLIAFVVEATAHLMAGIDASFDRPARRMAWLFVPFFRRMQPQPPASPVPGNGEKP